ncbi:MAG: superoxide dismutase [Chloroflexi bacterium]|nr:MAG: superoxide dismutase [Chloroflexota bacterium]
MTGTEGMTGTEATGAAGAGERSATAELQNATGDTVGTATFTQAGDGPVQIHVEVTGLTDAQPGPHGIHIHETGACTPDFAAAGGHFNPTGAQHGLDNANGPHAGDLPNIEFADDGSATYDTTTDLITLGEGDSSLFDADGSALVIHADADDQMTDPSGNSGDRIACGVIMQGAGQ